MGRITLGHDLLHHLQRAGDDGAAGLAGVEELLLVDLAGAGVVADEHHFDLLVVPLEEQVEQDEEALGDVLGRLGHRAGDVHQAEHHRLGGGVGLLDQQVVLEIEGIEERHPVDARAELGDFQLEFLDIAEVVRLFALDPLQFLQRRAQLGPAAAGQRDAPRMGRAQGADDVDARRVAVVADAGADGLEGVGAGDVALDQVGQLQVLEHEVEEFLLGDLEDEVVHAFAAVAGLAAAAAAPAAGWTGDVLAGGEFLVAGVDDGLPPATAMVQHRFVDIAPGNADLLAVLHVGNGTPADGLLDGLLDVFTVAPQEALAVHRALVLAVQTPVDDVAHECSSGPVAPRRSGGAEVRMRRRPVRSQRPYRWQTTATCEPAGTIPTAGGPASRCSRARPCV